MGTHTILFRGHSGTSEKLRLTLGEAKSRRRKLVCVPDFSIPGFAGTTQRPPSPRGDNALKGRMTGDGEVCAMTGQHRDFPRSRRMRATLSPGRGSWLRYPPLDGG